MRRERLSFFAQTGYFPFAAQQNVPAWVGPKTESSACETANINDYLPYQLSSLSMAPWFCRMTNHLIRACGFCRIAAMYRACAIGLSIALLGVSFQASYFHFHPNRASDHVEEHHLAQGLTIHTHLLIASHGAEHSAADRYLTAQEQDDAIFLAWSANRSHFYFSLTSIASKPNVAIPPDHGVIIPTGPMTRYHDPPLVLSTAPRSPPV